MIVVKGVNGVTLGDPLCVLLLAAGSNKGGVEVTPQSKHWLTVSPLCALTAACTTTQERRTVSGGT